MTFKDSNEIILDDIIISDNKLNNAISEYIITLESHFINSHYPLCGYIYEYDYILKEMFTINKLRRIRSSVNYKLQLEHVKFIPFITAIQSKSHPCFVSYLWQLMGKKERYPYSNVGCEYLSAHIYDTSTKEIIVKPAIQDILEWLYIDVMASDEIYENDILVLDEYAKIFDITYRKDLYNFIERS
jgi:hypothetical protein